METLHFPPVGRCARIVSGNAEALVTLDVGPRVIRFGMIGGPNLFKVFEDGGPLGDRGCLLYGGHRLWVGPEVAELTYHADNSPVEAHEEGGWSSFASAPDPRGVRKEIRIRPGAEPGSFELIHRLANECTATAEVFPWCLTVMAPGGECLFPLPPFASHTESVTPAAPVVLWSYTNLEDPRWSWGPRVARLRQTNAPPQKIGALVRQGYAAYALHGQLFLKRFEHREDAHYPDMGCNFETFTREDMLEVESLGSTVRLVPGESTELREQWRLFPNATPPENDSECASWLEALSSGF